MIPFALSAQTEIEFINHPYYKGKPMEKHTAKLSVKVRGMGYGGADSYLQINGNRSILNIPNTDSVYFHIKMNRAIIGNLSLYKSELTNNARRVKYYKQRTFSGADVGGDPISYNVSEVENGIYKITPSSSLANGEYMFIIQGLSSGMGDAFPFSVGDENKTTNPEEPKRKKKKYVDDVYGQ